MSQRPHFNTTKVFSRIAHYIRKAGAGRYITHGELVEKLMDDTLVKEYSAGPNEAWRIAEKIVGVFSSCFTKGLTKYNLEQYRREFSRSPTGGVWASRLRER